MKVKSLESKWEEIGWKPSIESFIGYMIAHFQQIYLGVRDVICLNINIFPTKEEGLQFINKCCSTFNCRVAYQSEGEVWIVRSNNPVVFEDIPSRFSLDENDHVIRGAYLGYSDVAIDNYFED